VVDILSPFHLAVFLQRPSRRLLLSATDLYFAFYEQKKEVQHLFLLDGQPPNLLPPSPCLDRSVNLPGPRPKSPGFLFANSHGWSPSLFPEIRQFLSSPIFSRGTLIPCPFVRDAATPFPSVTSIPVVTTSPLPCFFSFFQFCTPSLRFPMAFRSLFSFLIAPGSFSQVPAPQPFLRLFLKYFFLALGNVNPPSLPPSSEGFVSNTFRRSPRPVLFLHATIISFRNARDLASVGNFCFLVWPTFLYEFKVFFCPPFGRVLCFSFW